MNLYMQRAAEIDWVSPLTPASRRHGDIYWSQDSSTEEKRHVFIDGNHLPTRFEAVSHGNFTIAEIGFGFGINFLLTAELWRRARPRGAMLNYIAVENAPVPRETLRQFYERLRDSPGIHPPHSQRLIDRYPPANPGLHTLQIDDDIFLLLMIGDAQAALGELDARVDAWYLDGFSPAKNPDAWNLSVFRSMRHLSRPGATLATYSVAGAVRDGLRACDFRVDKAPGFGRKTEMLTARKPGNWQAQLLERPQVAIVGAGLAGLATAGSLSRRGISATVIDQSGPLTGASGIPALAIYPQLAVNPDARSLFSLAAFHHATAQADFIRSGRINVGWTDKEAERLARLAESLTPFARFCEPSEVAEVSGTQCGLPGLSLPAAGWIQPGIERGFTFSRRQISAPLLAGLADRFDHVVFAPGWHPFKALEPLGLTPVRGQAIEARFGASTLRTVLGGRIAAIPIGDGTRCIAGSTYHQDDTDLDERLDDSYRIAKLLEDLVADEIGISQAYTGIRCTTRDRQPIAGALPRWPALDAAIADAGVNKRGFVLPGDAYEQRLWVLTGLGSHGATTAPLLGEYLARLITGEASCLTRTWAAQLDAARFAMRDGGLRRSLSGFRPPLSERN